MAAHVGSSKAAKSTGSYEGETAKQQLAAMSTAIDSAAREQVEDGQVDHTSASEDEARRERLATPPWVSPPCDPDDPANPPSPLNAASDLSKSSELQQNPSTPPAYRPHRPLLTSSASLPLRTHRLHPDPDPTYKPTPPKGNITAVIAPEHWDCFWAHVANLQNWPLVFDNTGAGGGTRRMDRREAMALVEVRKAFSFREP